MNVLILGAGASFATHHVPIANLALKKWEREIRERYRLLAFAMEKWVGPYWTNENLEKAWTQIDVAYKERAQKAPRFKMSDLTDSDRRRVWQLAFETQKIERGEVNYYRTQIEWAQHGHSSEEFLSVVAGWELRLLIQQTFAVPVKQDSCNPYRQLIQKLKPTAVISFNYDTFFEQCHKEGWTYVPILTATSPVLVLKPHGSVNWVHRKPRRSGLTEQIYLDFPLRAENMGYGATWFTQNLVIGLREKIEHTETEESSLLRTFFGEILRACEQVLTQAEKIWIVGYSFAPADTTFLEILGRCVARREREQLPSLGVIDKGSPDRLLSRVREIFDVHVSRISHCFCGFEKWAKHGFCKLGTNS